MTSSADFALWYRLYNLEADYWRDVDLNEGRNAEAFYVPDGLFAIGGNQFRGREKIREFYAWRRQRARTTTRHLINNLQAEPIDERTARVVGLLSFHQADGRPPVLEPTPAILVADLVNECVRDGDGVWRFRSHEIRPVFMGDDVPLSLAFDLSR